MQSNFKKNMSLYQFALKLVEIRNKNTCYKIWIKGNSMIGIKENENTHIVLETRNSPVSFRKQGGKYLLS